MNKPLELARHITLTGTGRLYIDGVEFGYHLAEDGITARAGQHLAEVTVTLLAESFDFDSRLTPPEPPAPRRYRRCVEEWPDCEPGAYHPNCCRFPKSCSCVDYHEAAAEADLEPAPTKEN